MAKVSGNVLSLTVKTIARAVMVSALRTVVVGAAASQIVSKRSKVLVVNAYPMEVAAVALRRAVISWVEVEVASA